MHDKKIRTVAEFAEKNLRGQILSSMSSPKLSLMHLDMVFYSYKLWEPDLAITNFLCFIS
jgi:hypothetical protein